MIVDYFLVSKEGYTANLLDATQQLGRPTAKIAVAAYLFGAALAAYWTIIAPPSFGASLPVFVITGGLYWLGAMIFTRPSVASNRSSNDSISANANSQQERPL